MKEWYLEHNAPEIVSGYETETIEEYAQTDFTDILEISFSDEVILYNSNLTESRKCRCVIQDNLADTSLKSMERTILLPIGMAIAGMYLYFENSYWILDGRPGNNKSYEKITAKLCQYNLCWQTSDGKIHKRPINATSASKYDVGIQETRIMSLASNNYTIIIGYDEAALELEGMRVFIDKRKYKPKKVFKLTRDDDVLYDYGESGSILSFIVDRDELNLKTDNQDLRICDYVSSVTTQDTEPLLNTVANINGGNSIRVGRKKTWGVNFTDTKGNPKDETFSWKVASNFEVVQNVNNNKIQLKIDDENVIGHSFLLQVITNDVVIAQTTIHVEDAF